MKIRQSKPPRRPRGPPAAQRARPHSDNVQVVRRARDAA
jgi:hypothetical protein